MQKKINTRAAIISAKGVVGIRGEDKTVILFTPALARQLASQLVEMAAIAESALLTASPDPKPAPLPLPACPQRVQ